MGSCKPKISLMSGRNKAISWSKVGKCSKCAIMLFQELKIIVSNFMLSFEAIAQRKETIRIPTCSAFYIPKNSQQE